MEIDVLSKAQMSCEPRYEVIVLGRGEPMFLTPTDFLTSLK